jgi:hypothetical protein
MKSAWILYLTGAFLALVFKWVRWVHTGKSQGKTIGASTHEWLDIGLLSDKASWLMTIGVVWIVGSVCIGKVITETGIVWIDRVIALPMFNAAAFTLGVAMEYAAPALAKYGLSKIQSE